MNQDVITFNDGAIREIAQKLKPFITSSEKTLLVQNIITQTPAFTAVKVLAALTNKIINESAKPNFEEKNSYLVTLSSILQETEKKDSTKKAFLKQGNPPYLLVVVCNNNFPIHVVEREENDPICLFTKNECESVNTKKVIVIGNDFSIPDRKNAVNDKVFYGHLKYKKF